MERQRESSDSKAGWMLVSVHVLLRTKELGEPEHKAILPL